MSNKIIYTIIIVIIIVAAVIFALFKNNQSKMQMGSSSNTPSQSQTKSPEVTTQISENTVTIQNFAFTPANLTVKKGTKVTFVNKDSVGHSATADDKSFDTGVLEQNESKEVSFDKPGTYTYHCSVHPNMKAVITVE
jgi:plastocyanin